MRISHVVENLNRGGLERVVIDLVKAQDAAGHDCQVVDVDVTVRPYDTAIDLIVTPTRTIETRNEFPKPTHGVMWYLLEDDMLGRIPPLQELWAAEFCR